MKIIVDEMPNYPYECRNCRQEGDMEFHYWVCQVGEEKYVCKDTKKCPILWIAIRIASSSIICSKAEKASKSKSKIMD